MPLDGWRWATFIRLKLTNSNSIFLGSKGDDLYLVELLGFTCHACYLDGMVR